MKFEIDGEAVTVITLLLAVAFGLFVVKGCLQDERDHNLRREEMKTIKQKIVV